MTLTKKEIEILIQAFRVYDCKSCPHSRDREVCSCDGIYHKLVEEIETLEG